MDYPSVERVPEELNTVQRCVLCGVYEMLLRDPSRLPTGSVFAYCPWCGTAARLIVCQ